MNRDFLPTIKKAFDHSAPLVLCDDSDELGSAVLTLPACLAAPAVLNRMLHLSRGGTVEVAMSPLRADAFQLESMGNTRLQDEVATQQARELVSVEAREGVTTGISIHDRSRTVSILGEDPPQFRKIVKPGHIFPIRTREGGVLVRSALPEAALDIARISGNTDAACILELLDEQGEYLTGDLLKSWAAENNLSILYLSEIIGYRLQTENLVYRVAEAKLPTHLGGEMKSFLYRSDVYQGDHLALVKGDVSGSEPVLVRVQPENTFIDVFGSTESSGKGNTINLALHAIGEADRGVLVYLRRPDAGPLKQELSEGQRNRSKGTQMKEYGLGAQILRDLGVHNIILLAGSSTPLSGLAAYGLQIIDHQPLTPREQAA